MTTRVAALGAVALYLGVFAGASSGADESTVENARARLAAARKVYEGTWQRWRDLGRPLVVEELYRWSCRWLEAEEEVNGNKAGRVAAAVAHLDRMKQVESLAREMHAKGLVDPADVPATQFYRLEAERRLARSRGNSNTGG
jgi:hypothetical protein